MIYLIEKSKTFLKDFRMSVVLINQHETAKFIPTGTDYVIGNDLKIIGHSFSMNGNIAASLTVPFEISTQANDCSLIIRTFGLVGNNNIAYYDIDGVGTTSGDDDVSRKYVVHPTRNNEPWVGQVFVPENAYSSFERYDCTIIGYVVKGNGWIQDKMGDDIKLSQGSVFCIDPFESFNYGSQDGLSVILFHSR